jgi:RND superfamily putative drug exporter
MPSSISNRRTVRVARWSATHPWRAVALWLVFVAACIAIGNVVGLHQQGELDGTVGQSGRAAHWIHDAGLAAPDTENVLVTSRSGQLDLRQARAAAADAGSRMRRLHGVAGVGRILTSTDHSAVAVQITLRHDAGVGPLMDVTKNVQHTFPRLDVAEVGSASLNDAVNKQVASDLGAAAMFSLPVTLIILLIAFGAIIAAGVPILLALSAVGAATGLSALVSHVIPDSGSTSSMILLMGMAVGVDYSLFYVKRARAERHAGRSRLAAIEIAAETSGHSVLVSGAAVIVAMCGLFVAADVSFASLAAGSIVVVAIAVLGSLTVLPALLMLLGTRIDRPRVPVLWRWTVGDREPRLWPALLRPSFTHPGRTLLISVLGLVAVALPALGLTLASDSVKSLPDSIAAKHTYDRLVAAFPDQNTSTDIVVRAPGDEAGQVQQRLASLRDQLSGDPS